MVLRHMFLYFFCVTIISTITGVARNFDGEGPKMAKCDVILYVFR